MKRKPHCPTEEEVQHAFDDLNHRIVPIEVKFPYTEDEVKELKRKVRDLDSQVCALQVALNDLTDKMLPRTFATDLVASLKYP